MGSIERRTLIVYGDDALNADLWRLRLAWRKLRRSRSRDAIYRFLTDVFELVVWWSAEKRAINRVQRALFGCGLPIPKDVDPFAALIAVAAHPKTLDKRAISKWACVLRYADRHKSTTEALEKFVQRKGGINAVAALYARRMGRCID